MKRVKNEDSLRRLRFCAEILVVWSTLSFKIQIRDEEAEAVEAKAEALWWKRLEVEANSGATNSIRNWKQMQKNSKGEEAEVNSEA